MLKQYRGLRRELYILAFGRLVTQLGSMIWPMVTLILNQKMGVSGREVSVLLAVAMLIMAPAVYIGGKIADRRDKKMVIVVFDMISVVCYIASALIPLSWMSIFLIFIGSLSQNMEHPAYSALTADLSLTEDRDRAYSLQYLCSNLGLVLAPTIAGVLFKNYLWLAFLINGISIMCSMVMIFFFVTDISPVVDTSAAATYQRDKHGVGLLEVLRENPVILLFIFVMSGYNALYALGDMYLVPLDLAALHGQNGAVIYGSITSVNCVTVVLFTPIITRAFSKWSEPQKILTGIALLMAGYVMFISFKGMIPCYYIAMIVLTWGEIFTFVTESPFITRRVPSSHRGRVTGVFTFIRTVITSLLQFLIGLVYGAGGSASSWVMILAGCLVTIAAAYILIFRDRRAYPALYAEN